MRRFQKGLFSAGLALLCCLAGAVVNPTQGAEYRVPDSEAGIHTIADALSRTHTGDVVLISEGTYNESLVITTPSLTLIGLGAVTIQAPPPDVGSLPAPAVLVQGAGGTRMENLEIRGALGSRNAAVEAVDSSLFLLGVWAEGGVGASGRPVGGTGGNGLELVRSCCVATSSVLIGGQGGDGGSDNPPNRFPGVGGDGGHGVFLDLGSRIQLNSSSASGGDGGDAHSGNVSLPLPGGAGGDGIRADHNSDVALTATLLAGGRSGASYMTTSPEPGEPLRLLNDSTTREIASLTQQSDSLLDPNFEIPAPMGALDLNDDGELDVADLVARLAWCRP